MSENDFLPFATGSAANVLSQSDYAALAALASGFTSGVAKSAAVNKVLRQSSIMSAVLAAFIADNAGVDVIDDGTTGTIKANFNAALNALFITPSELSTALALKAALNGSVSNRFSAAPAVAATDVPQLQQIPQIQPVAASVASNALTATLNPTILQFRSATLTNGAVTPVVIGSALSLVVPSGATLGSSGAVQATYAVLALYNGGTPVLGIVNIAGGVDLSETGLISTTAISSSATSASTVYSAAAVTSSPYRVVGFITATEATAGTWATAPTLVQGAGGEAFGALQSFLASGVNATNMLPSRSKNATYYNASNKPRWVVIVGTGSVANAYLGASLLGLSNFLYGCGAQASGAQTTIQFMVPPGGGYSVTDAAGTVTMALWVEIQ